MAGLPQDRPIPGAPLLDPLGQAAAPILPIAPGVPGVPMAPQLPDVDPLTGLPMAAPPLEQAPQGYQFDSAGEPLPWPPDDWFAQPDGQAPGEVQGHDVPVVEDKAAPEPPATAAAGEQGIAALEQARAQGNHTVTAPEAGKNAPAGPRPTTGDPYLDTMYEGEDRKVQAELDKAEAEKRKNLYLSEQGSRAAQDQSDRQASADKEYRQVYNEARTHREQLDQEAQAIANTKTDPKRMWNNMSFGAQLFVGITAALTGATTRAVQTGQNPVLDQINKMVERDLAAQQADLDNRWKGNNVRRGLLADELAAGRDMYDVQYKALNVAYDTAMNQAKSYAMRFDNPVIDARTNAFIAETMERKATLGHELQAQKEAQIHARRQEGFQNSIAQGHLDLARRKEAFDEYQFDNPQAKPPTVRDQVALSKEQREQQKYHDERLIPEARTKKGGEVLALQEGDAKDIRTKMGTVSSMNQKFDRLEQIYAKHGYNPLKDWNILDSEAAEDAKEARLIMGNILPEWSKSNEQGVIRDKEYPMYFKMFGDATGLLDPRTNFKKMREMSVQGMNNELRTRVGEDVAWWSPKGVAGGDDTTDTTSEFSQKQKQKAEKQADRSAPRPEWEIVGDHGDKSLTAGNVVIPKGRQIVGQTSKPNAGGRMVDTYELDDGSTLDVEE